MFSRAGARLGVEGGAGGTPGLSRGGEEFASPPVPRARPTTPARRRPGAVRTLACGLALGLAVASVSAAGWVSVAWADPVPPSGAAIAAPSAYGRLLARHVRPGRIGDVDLSVVDYAVLARDPDYAAALRDLAAADPDALASEADRFAFWINAYNLLAIRTVVDHYPVSGIRDVGSFLFPVWKREAGKVAGRPVSLDHVEHAVLRPRFRDPRVHFAIVCASVSCPDLRAEAYDGARLDEQLDDAVRRFVANPAKGVAVGGTVRVSSIFRWFADDFGPAGVVAFLKARMEPAAASRLAGLRDGDLDWIDYDWSLNDAARSRR